ncbi:MAG: PD40 domain-containing protein [Gemmatimonadales bacterium]|nr:PD40 domain-containing protein [Gemmatimonadales bacterium]
MEAGSPDWSRDGTQLLFVSFEDGAHGSASFPFIVTIDTSTGRVVRHGRLPLPKEIQNALWAVWSPVSDEVALEADLGGGRHSLWVVNSDGTAARKLTEYPMRTYGGVSWASGGKALVYAALTEGRMQLFAIPAAGGAPRQLTRNSANLFTPRTSPDGRLVAATRVSHLKEVRRIPLPR